MNLAAVLDNDYNNERNSTRLSVKRFWLYLLFILLISFIVYHPALKSGYIWDDDTWITDNPNLFDLEGLKRIWFNPETDPQYYPLTLTTFWIEYQAWGLKSFGYHFDNIIFHSMNAFLIALILLRLRMPGAILAAGIFAIHPIHVESVVWITERKNVLSGFLYLLSLYYYIHFMKDRIFDGTDEEDHKHQSEGIHWKFYIVSLVFFICALLSKSVTATLPAVIIVIIWWQSGKIPKRDVFLLSPFFILGIGMGITTALLEVYHIGARGPEFDLNLIGRFLVAGRALWFYLSKLIWPDTLMFIYPRWSIHIEDWKQYLFPILFLFSLMGAYAFRKKIGRGISAALLIFAGTLFPALGFLNVYPHIFSYVADHFQYLASVVIIVLIVSLLYCIRNKLFLTSKKQFIFLVIVLLILFNLGMRAGFQVFNYQDSITLWEDTIAQNPDCWIAYTNLGGEYGKSHEFIKAIEFSLKAIQLKPNNEMALANLANAYFQIKKYPEALQWEEKVIQICEKQAGIISGSCYWIIPNVYRDRGIIFAQNKQYDLSLKALNTAIKMRPHFPDAYKRIGMVYALINHYTEAIDNYRKALVYLPNDAQLNNKLGIAYLMSGDIDNSIVHFKRALEIAPELNEAKMNLNLAINEKEKRNKEH